MTDKEKQIEEMAKDVTGSIVWCSLEDDFLTVDGFRTAEVLYEIGYRKQVEGEWRGEIRTKCDWRGKKQQYFQPNSCSLCHEPVYERTLFCPNCGAKMRGGVG